MGVLLGNNYDITIISPEKYADVITFVVISDFFKVKGKWLFQSLRKGDLFQLALTMGRFRGGGGGEGDVASLLSLIVWKFFESNHLASSIVI